ncbi:YibE/F family protein [Paractinoplanes deccanensis]|uniref:YibE/F family protein n=1 Tax=Paractinoplanes deccanensis TaxID=113561 RepID=UPI0027DB69DF|nr:YibE/F family protein [Actinoplanes deccanensis]
MRPSGETERSFSRGTRRSGETERSFSRGTRRSGETERSFSRGTRRSGETERSFSPPSRWQLYRAAIRIGRAHVGSAVNTIVLAYAGASLPLLLLIATGTQPIGDLLTGELLAQEILRSAVGTIGLVASVPITTLLAVLVADRGHRFT